MRVFVAGASGAIGRRLVPQLIDAGHEVTGTTTTPSKVDLLHELGAEPVVLDVLDAAAVERAVIDAKPDAVVHEATALTGLSDFRHFDRSFAQTNRIRTAGTDALIAAAAAAGAGRFVAQSFASHRFVRSGAWVKTEDDALDTNPPAAMRETVEAMAYLDHATVAAGGLALRYGGFYGDRDDEMVAAVRGRKFPIVGDGGGVWSLIHLDDAAAATVLALEQGEPGVYHVVDDDPAPVRDWLPVLAEALGAKPPMRFPRWLARIVAGEVPVVMATEARGASNAKARRELRWSPRHPSWREGFRAAYS
ncbi:MAG TPA: NAD(P)-dependent oxidoreductase [Actinomycetota bacterium]|nr:NAD(P)-dependent oxidoreductase [Actinomycetota bacterium]